MSCGINTCILTGWGWSVTSVHENTILLQNVVCCFLEIGSYGQWGDVMDACLFSTWPSGKLWVPFIFSKCSQKVFLIVGRTKTGLYSRSQSLSEVEFVRSHKVHVCLTMGNLSFCTDRSSWVCCGRPGTFLQVSQGQLLVLLWCWWISYPLKSFSLLEQHCKSKWSLPTWRWEPANWSCENDVAWKTRSSRSNLESKKTIFHSWSESGITSLKPVGCQVHGNNSR